MEICTKNMTCNMKPASALLHDLTSIQNNIFQH